MHKQDIITLNALSIDRGFKIMIDWEEISVSTLNVAFEIHERPAGGRYLVTIESKNAEYFKTWLAAVRESLVEFVKNPDCLKFEYTAPAYFQKRKLVLDACGRRLVVHGVFPAELDLRWDELCKITLHADHVSWLE